MATKALGNIRCAVGCLKKPSFFLRSDVKVSRPNASASSGRLQSLTLHTKCQPLVIEKWPSLCSKHLRDVKKMFCVRNRPFTQFMAVAKPSSNTDGGLTTENGGTFYFDTHKLVTTLQARGFSLEQSEAITNSLTQVIGKGASALSKYMVSRNELAQLEIRMNATIEALRKDMVILEKSEFLMLKQENESLKSEVSHLSRVLKDELLKLKSALTLDLSLEKGRTKEESSIHEQKIKDANNRIETEIAHLKFEMEAQKLDLIKYIVGSFLSVVTVLIGWWRFVKS